MNRRGLLLGVPTVAVGTLCGVIRHYRREDVAAPTGKRISVIKGDPGERLYCELCGDGKRITVLIDGVEEMNSVTADETQGYIVRAATTENGNIAYNAARGEVLYETVHGKVEIIIS